MDELYSLNTDFHTKHFDQITEALRLFSQNTAFCLSIVVNFQIVRFFCMLNSHPQ